MAVPPTVGFGWAQQRTGVECEVRGSGAVARGVGVFGEVLHECEKCRRLADEESHVGKKLDHALGDAFGFSRANDGAWRQLATDERARLWHDQVGQKIPPPKGEVFRSGKVTDTPVTGSTAVKGGALPALSDQV